jgi:hypothetical protein
MGIPHGDEIAMTTYHRSRIIPVTIRRNASGPSKIEVDDGTIQRLLDIRQRAPRPATRYWESLGCVLKDGRSGSVVEVGRIQDNGIKFDLAGLAELYGMELSRIIVDHCLPGP